MVVLIDSYFLHLITSTVIFYIISLLKYSRLIKFLCISSIVLYHHCLMGSHSTVGQSEPLYSSNTMVKRPRLESSHTIYPQRPGEKACAFYMRNRTCKYGEDCKFDHPQWVLEGGIPNWRELTIYCLIIYMEVYIFFITPNVNFFFMHIFISIYSSFKEGEP
jgi:hypothetical protein